MHHRPVHGEAIYALHTTYEYSSRLYTEKYRPQLLAESHFNLCSLYATTKIKIAPQDLSVSSTKKAIRSDVDIILSMAYNICRPSLDHL